MFESFFHMTKLLVLFVFVRWSVFLIQPILQEKTKERYKLKKLLIGLITLIVIGVAALKIADIVVMGGDSYYVQVTTDGTKQNETDSQGQTYTKYQYQLPGYDQNGEEKSMDFSTVKERPLRKEAFLKLTWNKNKGVTSFEEVKEKEVPKKAQEKLLEAN
ncbi:hypothetical protein IGI49_004249 [Enterococcus sp. AZ071]